VRHSERGDETKAINAQHGEAVPDCGDCVSSPREAVTNGRNQGDGRAGTFVVRLKSYKRNEEEETKDKSRSDLYL